ncbi:hypothetical protein THAOC_18442 [Thalassiosira oceanica]|uniref:J domain-containing protein n=1 Tax=Thalassiosira oceanica TaxID=159749 RepID=K0S890_THAOC|nr:hypothetical protein THAOC_18442 [Thalassiosira oceanica]|eukprot:EJK61119.1 hypothetical protein THAOC_18442 [Thalassiosira oceanica]
MYTSLCLGPGGVGGCLRARAAGCWLCVGVVGVWVETGQVGGNAATAAIATGCRERRWRHGKYCSCRDRWRRAATGATDSGRPSSPIAIAIVIPIIPRDSTIDGARRRKWQDPGSGSRSGSVRPTYIGIGTSDPFGLLGLSWGATITEIKEAYRRKARELHPDVSKLDPAQALSQFRTIKEAYESLLKNKNADHRTDVWEEWSFAVWRNSDVIAQKRTDVAGVRKKLPVKPADSLRRRWGHASLGHPDGRGATRG